MKNNGLVILLILTLYLNSVINVKGQSVMADSLKPQIEQMRLSLSKKENSEKVDLYKSIGAAYQRLNMFDSALTYYNQGLQLAVIENNLKLQSSLHYNISIVNMITGQYDVALQNALTALELDKQLLDTAGITMSLNSMALIYQEWGRYEKSLEYRLESIRLSELNNNQQEIANGKYNLGNTYMKIGKLEQALENFEEARVAFDALLVSKPKNISLKQALSECYYSLGVIDLQKGNGGAAFKNLREALSIKMGIADKVGMASCYYQIGLIQLKQKEYEMARQSLFQALQLKHQVGDTKGIALVNHQIANLYFVTGLLNQSEVFVGKSIPFAELNDDKEILSENYKLLYQIYSQKSSAKQALQYHVLYKAYADSVLTENTTKIVEELSVRYETEKKEKENVLLQQENEISTLTIQKQKSLGRYLVGVIFLVLSIVVILYILFRSKQKTNKVISHKNTLLGEQNTQIIEQKKEIEVKNRNLTDSIVYAKRIQESMLEDEQKLNSLIDDAFIYFKPKDIVSGDFYWFGEIDGKVVVSAIDCTGHGVPGAFMSMLGNSFLNQIILNKGITSPEIILEELSKEVQVALKQAETNNRDGMDMALCTIDKERKLVEFSGAKNPLVYIKNGVAERIKGDKNPIGMSYGSTTEFQKHSVNVDTTTCFYMFSDGYIDQFGGPRRKKFMVKNLQNLLLEIHEKPMNAQKEILSSTLDDWMKGEEQIDDVIVMGFRVQV